MGRLAIITGADGDMGTEITRAVAKAGFDILMLCHTQAKGEKRRDQLVSEVGNNSLRVMEVDLSSMTSVNNVANAILKDGRHIDLLMNNAGTMSKVGFVATEDGLERTVAVNYMGHFLLTTKLLPLMGRGTRIVNMISLTYAIGRITPSFFARGCEGSFWRIPVYSNTKLALWLFTRKLSKYVAERGISVNAADPGIVSTKFIHLDLWFDPLTDIFFRPCINSPAKGAATAISLLLDKEWEGVSGGMFAKRKQRRLSKKFLSHTDEERLWEDTISFLRHLALQPPAQQ